MSSEQERAAEAAGGETTHLDPANLESTIPSDDNHHNDSIADDRVSPAQTSPSRAARPQLPRDRATYAAPPSASGPASATEAPLTSPSSTSISPFAADRIFPIRSVITVEPTQTPSQRSDRHSYGSSAAAAAAATTGYFPPPRRQSLSNVDPYRTRSSTSPRPIPEVPKSPRPSEGSSRASRQSSTSANINATVAGPTPQRAPPQYLNKIMADASSVDGDRSRAGSERPPSARASSFRSAAGTIDDAGLLVTARFKHVVTEGGHAIITGRDGETLQRCEDEPIHIPGAIQGFGLLIAMEEMQEGKLVVRVVSENSARLIGYTPKQLFALDSFTDILSDDQTDNLLDHVDFIRDEDADVVVNGPEVFTLSVRTPQRRNQKFWCAMHINDRHPDLIICEFELEEDPANPLVPPNEATPEPPEDTLDSRPTDEELQESTQISSKPLRVLRSARKRKGEAAAMEVFNIMSQVQEQLASAPNLELFLKILVGVVKELTGFHRVMIYQFDQAWNGRVVTELVDPRATKDLYKGLNFPASDIPKQARDLYKINKVRMLYDRDHQSARLVCRTIEDLENPLDLTHSYLRAMSPIHLKYLANMAVRSSISISINAFEELWGLIACHTYGSKGMRVSFPIRKMCRLIGDSASRNIERLSYASRLQARKLINTVPTQSNPSGYIVASSEDLLKLFDADFGLLSIRDETKILGQMEQSQEGLAMLEYLRMRRITNVMTSIDIKADFPDLRYPPGFKLLAGLLLVPLSIGGQDFIVFFRKGQLREVKWAGNPYEKFIKEGTEGYLEPRKSFRTWSEMVIGKCREWTEEEIETAAVLCLVYGKFIEVWRQKEAALQNSQLTRLLLANSAHEVRTPLNAIINYLEIALEGSLDKETRENLAKSHSASKSLIYVINDLLDLTKTEEGGELVKDEIFDLKETLAEATDMFRGDTKRKSIDYAITAYPGLPSAVIGDQRRIRQIISNITANAIQNTTVGGITVEMYVVSREENRCEIETSVTDTGVGMSAKKLDQLFRELEQVQTEGTESVDPAGLPDVKSLLEPGKKGEERCLGLGLAVVARIIRNMNGQLRLKSEEGKGSRFVIQLAFEIPDTERKQARLDATSSTGSVTPHAEIPSPSTDPDGEVTLIQRGHAARRASSEEGVRNEISRKNSAESMGSRRSLNSIRSGLSNLSFSSQRSGKSEADRLIEAIQEPHRVEGFVSRSSSARGDKKLASSVGGDSPTKQRPKLDKRHTTSSAVTSVAVTTAATTADISAANTTVTRPKSIELPIVSDQATDLAHKPGQASVTDQGMPLRPVRVHEDYVASPTGSTWESSSASAAPPSATTSQYNMEDRFPVAMAPPNPGSAAAMHVLVAEDDPVNSRIIKKRLEKLGHVVFLTVNGEDCASTYCDKSGVFDIILMDMQMPIVDGLTSTKMIRSYEKSHPSHALSPRGSLNGRVPIIAVSASLVERNRQIYIDGGFDGWILKPISFRRMTDIMTGIVNESVRRANLYSSGNWEHGGWFEEARLLDPQGANTKPSGEPPISSSERVRVAAASDDPTVKEEQASEQTQEQVRLAEAQAAEKSGGVPSAATEGKELEATAAADVPAAESASAQDPPTEDPPS